MIETTDQVSLPGGGLPLGTSAKDLELMLRVNAEHFRKVHPEAKYFSLNHDLTTSHPLYREKREKVFNAVILVPTFFIYRPPANLLRRYGLEEVQSVIAIQSCRVNDELGVEVKTGDMLEYLGVKFEVLSVQPGDYFLNTQVPLNKVVSLKNLENSPTI